jgi:glyoxylase-like metal-dependent hydrolase (beta-lactamase superfamily II)
LPDGYHRIKLPLPFALGFLNVYLVPSGEGWILIDCGMETAPSQDALQEAFTRIGARLEDIRTIVLTHMHPDHSGMAARLKQISGARIMAHPEERQVLESVLNGERSRWQDDTLRAAGSPEEMVLKIRASFNALRRALGGLKTEDVESIGDRVGSLDVVWTAGHSRGHICLYDPAARRLFSGDQILEKGPPNIGWEDDHDALEVFLESLDQLHALEVEEVLPAHGEPFDGHRQWIERAKNHHHRRCLRIEEILAAGPKTPHQIAMTIWPGAVTPLDYRFAVFEILAHLKYMERRNRVKRAGMAWCLVARDVRETIQ